MLLQKKLLHASLALVWSALSVTLIAAPSSCGGCYNDEEVTDLRTEPASACLMLSSGGVNPCTGEYNIFIDNACAEDFQLFSENTLIGASETVMVKGSTAESRGDTRALSGALGSDQAIGQATEHILSA